MVGDGAVGLCAVLAARRLGAERIIVMGHHDDRLAVARSFGATDEVRERGREGIARVRQLTGAARPMRSSASAPPGRRRPRSRSAGRAGRSATSGAGGALALMDLHMRNVAMLGGVAPVRADIPELLEDALAGRLDPSPVMDLSVGLDGVPEGYAAMDERRAIKALVAISSP